MNKSKPSETSRGWFNAALMLVVILVAITAAVKDFDHLKDFTSDLGIRGSRLASAGMTRVHASGLSRVERNKLQVPAQTDDQFQWTGHVAQGKSIEIKGINGSISAEPASGDQVEVSATKTGRRSDPSQVSI
ncbi:MAG TPA: hypothetical protein VN956_01505, partial [Pyrinomonadaceae bacterium]|nr:hypothetical protein [Pyrinomonadaceae bacterium]